MRKPLIAGNWKMNGTRAQLSALCAEIIAGLDSSAAATGPEVGLFAPHPYLAAIVECASASRIMVGAQDVAAQAPGAFTGEVAAEMVKDIGCQWTLVGHSERRTLFGDTNSRVAAKVNRALACGLRVMLCVGETLQEREAGRTSEVVCEQLDAVLSACGGAPALTSGAIAYEPVWAIGTGLTATPEQANEVHAVIRARLGAAGAAMRILYGGSVKADNAAGLLSMPDIDGALVGGASLEAGSFLGIVRAAG